MSRFHSYIRTAEQIISEYNGNMPFAHFAKQFFAKEKKFGSTDRRQISALCYNYFRVAKALGNVPVAEKFVAATFLCETKPTKLLEVLHPAWNEAIELPLKEKIQLLNFPFDQTQLFPFPEQLSGNIDKEAFALSFLTQPDLFLRIRPKQEKLVLQKLSEKDISYKKIDDSCIALANGSKVEEIITLNKEAVVQDYSSQQTGKIMQEYALNHLPKINSWDCCAASGGKSIMLHDLRPDAQMTVSDIRLSILYNLQQRFHKAEITKFQSFVVDLAKPDTDLTGKSPFNLIITDVPCTGSGTWARTPEQLFFFKEQQIAEYAKRQLAITSNVMPRLQTGGFLVYITCSVFHQENEAIVEKLLHYSSVKLIHQQYVTGYDIKADTLFIAILQKL